MKKKLDIKDLWGKVKSMWKKPPEGRNLSLKEMGTFGLYALGNSFLTSGLGFVVSVAFLPYFYHIATIHAYIILALGAVLNLVLQPIIGFMMERTHTKWGKYKPYILFSVPIFMLLVIMATWIPQFSIEKTRIIYAYLTSVPVIVLQNFSNNMYNTMPTVITPVSQERADMMTPIGLIVGFAPSVLQVIIGFFRGYYQEKGQEFMALRILGIISAVLGFILVLFIIKVKERVYIFKDEKIAKEKVSFKESIKMLTKNKPLMIVFLALSLGSFREFVRQFQYLVFQTRFSESIAVATKYSGIVMTVIGFASTVAMLLLPLVTRKMDKHKACIMFTVCGTVVYGLLGIIGYQRIPLGWASSLILTASYFIASITPVYLIVPMMLGEVADYQQRVTGKRLEGHIQALLFSVPLLVSQVGMIFFWFLQNKIGFEPGNYNIEGLVSYTAEQQAVACSWFNISSIISSVSGILMVITLCFYPLTRKKYEKVIEELKEMATLNIQKDVTLLGKVIEDGYALAGGEIVNAQDINVAEGLNIVEQLDRQATDDMNKIDKESSCHDMKEHIFEDKKEE